MNTDTIANSNADDPTKATSPFPKSFPFIFFLHIPIAGR